MGYTPAVFPTKPLCCNYVREDYFCCSSLYIHLLNDFILKKIAWLYLNWLNRLLKLIVRKFAFSLKTKLSKFWNGSWLSESLRKMYKVDPDFSERFPSHVTEYSDDSCCARSIKARDTSTRPSDSRMWQNKEPSLLRLFKIVRKFIVLILFSIWLIS